MDLEALDYFIQVVRRGSFAAVARDADLDPSAVSRSIAALEASLGHRLFQRTTRRLALTEAGELLLRRAEPLLAEVQQVSAELTDLKERPAGRLRLQAPVSFAQLNVTPYLPEFLRLHPGLSLELILNDASLDLVAERIDLAIRLGPLADSGLVAQPLLPMVPRVCATPSYLARHGWPRTPEALAHHACLNLVLPGFGDVWKFRDASGRVTEVPVQGPLRTSNAIALKQGAMADLGIILQAEWIVAPELISGALVDLFPHHEVTAAHFGNAAWFLYPSRAFLPLKVRRFMGFLRERLQSALPEGRRPAPSKPPRRAPGGAGRGGKS
ncbi:LysR family transcriptional regulator [Geothrix alkalitolerans]|uniref:LysR family transcriptional regulator n=1 Tax=Geothrix alkalitolerans TaxID=2922724 RepID=UPI001FAF2809|nr:LysR family transcriptional regulator [Geothrix alkalitolerans]